MLVPFMRRPIEILLVDGLGNQMFQYALGRSLSIRWNRPLVLNTSDRFLMPKNSRGFELQYFRLGEQRVRNVPFLLFRARRKLFRTLGARGIRLLTYREERSLLFCPEVLNRDETCLLRGFWQSERYFESITDQLRAEFTFATQQDARSAACERHIRNVNSIALHVRRGDYVTHPNCSAFHGTCPKEYYDAGMNIVLPRVGPDPELFVFSDDIAWCRANIRYPLPTTYVDWNAERNYEDLRLMSACTAQIVANSTFSWWGAWLNPRKDKTVVAPRQWYRAPEDLSDLPNSRWLIAI